MKSSEIPTIKLDREHIASHAEALGMMVYASSLPKAYLIRADEEVLIITQSNGYLRLKVEEIHSLIEELANIEEDIKR